MMELELNSILEFGAGLGIGCLVAGAAFWIYAIRKTRSQHSQESGLPVHLGRDLKQAVILEKESGNHTERSISVSSKGRFFGWMSPQRKADPTTDVYIPSSRRIPSPTCAKPESPPPAATPRIYVLPVSPSGTSPTSTIVPAKLDRRSKSSKQGELLDTVTIHTESPVSGGLIKVDKYPNRDLLRSPVKREKQQGEHMREIGRCSGLESDESDCLETKSGDYQANKGSKNQTNLHCKGEQSTPTATPTGCDAHYATHGNCGASSVSQTSSVHNAPNPENLTPSQNDMPRYLVGLPGLHVEVVDSDMDNILAELNTSNPDNKQAIYMISLVVEEVLPRPDAGLLKRMLRMAEVPTSCVEGFPEPIFNLHPASQCHLSIGMIAVHGLDARLNISGPIRVSIRPIDGGTTDLDVNYEQVDTSEHIATAFWDMNSHQSKLLTAVPATSPSSTSLTPIEISFGFHVGEKGETNPRHEITVKKTILANMRKGSLALGVGDQYRYSEKIVQYVLSELELISMPSLLMFLRVYE